MLRDIEGISYNHQDEARKKVEPKGHKELLVFNR